MPNQPSSSCPLLRRFARDGRGSATPPEWPPLILQRSEPSMGKGDKKTRRGKIWRGTFGKRRPRARNEKPAAKAPAAK